MDVTTMKLSYLAARCKWLIIEKLRKFIIFDSKTCRPVKLVLQ